VSPERDEPIEDQEPELYEDVPPRSIFAATWFRVVLVVIVLGVVGAVAVPYVLDWMNPPPTPRTATTTTSPLAPGSLTPTTPSTVETLVGGGPPADRLAEKKDSTTIQAPGAATAMPAPARSESKSEPGPGGGATTAKPPAESKPAAKAGAPEPKPQAKRGDTSGEDKGRSATAGTGSSATATKPTASQRTVAKATTPATVPATAPATGGPYWVQIGAFKDPETAKRVAAKLREENFKVEESVKRVGGATSPPARSSAKTTTPAGADQYDVFVTGMSIEELNRRLAGKGLSAETSGAGVVVKPSLPLRDAVALSKDLAVEGFRVQVRRSGAPATAPAVVSAPSPAPDEGGQALHRVRVGAFPDRAAAVAAARELESKGFKPYIARGDQ
jgi:cell division septation protein DedD